VLATTLPYATSFYLNYIVVLTGLGSCHLLRGAQLAKYFLWRALGKHPEEAAELCEPEDQDFYGIGSRSARWTIQMCIGIVFGTLSPPVSVLTFLNFAVVRVVYGYLIPFAETKKPDLGGVFWVSQLKHLFVGNIIYCILMIGVLAKRAANLGPMIIAAPSLGYVIWSMQRFTTQFNWEKLPFEELMLDKVSDVKTPRESLGTYVQPELMPASSSK